MTCVSSLVSPLVSSPPLDLFSSVLSSACSSDCGQFSTCPGRYVVLKNTGCAFWFAVSLVACSGGMDPLAASSPLDRSFASVPSIVRTVSANGTTHLVRSRWCLSGCERASQSAAVCATARHLWQSHAVAALAAPFWRVTVASHGCTILA